MPSTRRRFLVATGVVGAAGVGVASYESVRPSRYSPGTDDATEWPMPGYDNGNSGYVPDAAVPRDGVSVRWNVDLPGFTNGRPVVAAGRVLVPTASGLFAYDLADGTEQWRVGGDHPWAVSPVVHDGIAYVGSADPPGPTVRAVNVEDGSEVWSYDTRGVVRAPPVAEVYEDDPLRALYVGDDTGRIYRFDPETGTVEYHRDVFGVVTRMAFGRTLVVGTEGGEVYSFYPEEDRFQGLWRRKVMGKVTAIATVDAELFVATFGGPMYRLQDGAHAGRSRWEHDDGAIDLAVTPAAAVGADGGGLDVLHSRTGEEQWTVDQRFHAAPAVAGDLLVAGGGELGERGSGFVAAYDLTGDLASGVLGRAHWTFETDQAVVEGVAVADGAVFAATQGADGPAKLYALDPA